MLCNTGVMCACAGAGLQEVKTIVAIPHRVIQQIIHTRVYTCVLLSTHLSIERSCSPTSQGNAIFPFNREQSLYTKILKLSTAFTRVTYLSVMIEDNSWF